MIEASAIRQVPEQREQSRADTAQEIAMANVFGTNATERLDAADGVTNGNDNVWGYDGQDTLLGLDGNDWLRGGTGDDFLVGGKGGDHLVGGEGSDWASYDGSSEGVYVDLFGGFGLYGDAADDTLYSIENLFGSQHDDVLVGNAQANILKGVNGEDSLLGFDGADTLYGGGDDDNLYGHNGTDTLRGDSGDDRLDGGFGRDTMHGGADADTFIWKDVTETGLNVLTADRIMDFNAGEGDLIDLSGIDANVYAGGNQAFTFVGNAAFSGAPGEVRYYHSGGNTYLQLQTGMEADIEGLIRIDGIHVPDASWFVL
jgi:Ca2+-binding RTX toxin-like protein